MSNAVELEWAQVDVFAEHALEGNMLAIFPNAHGLSDDQMQALARETNLSETTFILRTSRTAFASVSSRQNKSCPLPAIPHSALRVGCANMCLPLRGRPH